MKGTLKAPIKAEIEKLKNEVGAGTLVHKSPDGFTISTHKITAVLEITLSKGSWIVFGTVDFNSNPTGIRACAVELRMPSAEITFSRAAQSSNAVSGSDTWLQHSEYIEVTKDTKLYLWAFQTSNDLLTIWPSLNAIKVK